MHHKVLAAASLVFSALFALPVVAQPTRRPAEPPPVSQPRAAGAPKPAAPLAAAPGAAADAARPAAAPGKAGTSGSKPPKASPRARILRQKVGLSDERAAKVERIMDRNAPEKRKAKDEIREARRSLRELLRSGSDDQKAYGRALDRLRSGQRALQTIRDRELDAIRRELLPKEQALLLGTAERLKRQASARNARRPAPRR